MRRRVASGEDVTDREVAAHTEVQGAQVQPVPVVRTPSGLPEEVPAVPHLFPQPVALGGYPGSGQGQLVGEREYPMNMTDPVADLITRIRNGVRAKLTRVDVPSSKLKMEIARILKDEGYISNYRLTEDNKQGVLRVYLKYGPGMERVITDLQRVSRPGCRIYCGKDQIPRVYGGLGINILSTSRGLMTGKSAAREGVGGEILVNVW